jgi:hypothetical protein
MKPGISCPVRVFEKWVLRRIFGLKRGDVRLEKTA